jgi:radical SAM family uncharacterized protein/radical SAM-linked protein
MNLTPELEEILQQVQKPGRYVGGEWNAVKKDPSRVRLKIALAFPDLYEVGMSYLGQKVLYHILNMREDVLAERVYAPWPDMERVLRNRQHPLFSLENRIPLVSFDILGFSLLYELNYTNILTILDLGGIPLLSFKRTLQHPLVVAGGPAAFNPEPLADIIDLFLIGDGEEAFPEMVDAYLAWHPVSRHREELLARFSDLAGVYVPSRYRPYKPKKSPLLAVRPLDQAPAVVDKRVCRPFAEAPYPEDIIVPNIQIIHDRVAVEVERGCPQNCRFCQARQVYFPARPKDPSHVAGCILSSLKSTGYESVSLASLSVTDYPQLEELISVLMDELSESKVALSLPSLRPEGLTPGIVEQILKVRKTGFTLVPEAGTQRLRRVINKDLHDRDIQSAAENAFRHGWHKLKLYFMLGLPTETDADVDGIVVLIQDILRLGQEVLLRKPEINLSVASFIPKPHTPFQWLGMTPEPLLRQRQERLKYRLKRFRSVRFKEHGMRSSILEAVFSRGDRRLNQVLLSAWESGARFDSWSDRFDWNLWENAFSAQGLDPRIFLGDLDRSAVLPWDHIHTGVKKTHLQEELDRALSALSTPPCRDRLCRECGGCICPPPPDRSDLAPPELKNRIRVSSWGDKSDTALRYRLMYSKLGTARFISHLDLVNLIQRSFRRARIPVEYSQGFHPKMRMTFAPALALGMQGKRELLEFRSRAELPPAEFVRRINAVMPEGVRGAALERQRTDEPSLSAAIERMVYSVDLDRKEIVRSLQRLLDQETHAAGLTENDVLELRLQAYLQGEVPDALESLELNRETNQLHMILRVISGRSPRPQELVATLFEIPYPAFALTREELLLTPG